MFILLLISLTLLYINALIPCDDAYGQYCPEESGIAVGECLQKDQEIYGTLSDECKKYIEIHSICKDDISNHCTGKEFTDDLLVCLTEWTKPESLSSTCLDTLPKKAEKTEKRKLSKEEKKKADQRRKIRNKATKMARDQL